MLHLKEPKPMCSSLTQLCLYIILRSTWPLRWEYSLLLLRQALLRSSVFQGHVFLAGPSALQVLTHEYGMGRTCLSPRSRFCGIISCFTGLSELLERKKERVS